MKKILYIFYLLFSSLTFSQVTEEKLMDDLKKAEDVIGVMYEEIYERLNEKDQLALKESQEAWLKFREVNCKFKGKEDEDITKSNLYCLVQTSLARIKEFHEIIKEL